jgi:hypothetical protein
MQTIGIAGFDCQDILVQQRRLVEMASLVQAGRLGEHGLDLRCIHPSGSGPEQCTFVVVSTPPDNATISPARCACLTDAGMANFVHCNVHED